MAFYQILSILVGVCALFAYINIRFLKLPSSIGLMLLALIFSILIMIEGNVSAFFHDKVHFMIKSIDFPHILLDIMLGFLLFAGSLHVNFNHLRKQGIAVAIFALLGTALSTFLFAFIINGLFSLFNLQVDLIYCLLFGALISPTDPIAVLGIITKTKVPKEISIIIEGESLFNDGIGVVFFLTILSIINIGPQNLSLMQTTNLFLSEVVGGIALGLLLGFIVIYFLKKINDYKTIVLISLALVMLCAHIAKLLHVSGPLAIIIIGLMFGTKSQEMMNETTKDYHHKFWELIDDLLNVILFVLIGLQIVLLPFLLKYFLIGLIAIVILLLCRYVSLRIPMLFLKDKKLFNNKSALIMTWGGLRGGLSVALTLSLPESAYKEIIVSITFIIVVFSVIVQGLSMEKLIKRVFK
jgi:CPA1 family monovalent cation:H+ antiporter